MRPPLLAVDVDGVISLFGFDPPLAPALGGRVEPPPADPGAPPGPVAAAGPGALRYELIDGSPHVISVAAGERLARLAARFELCWATGWQDRANDRLGPLLGLGPLPVIAFDEPGREPPGAAAGPAGLAAHWKLEAIDRFAEDRAIAWVDDRFDRSCLAWCERRERAGHPTLLVPTESDRGLEEGHVAALEAWAGSLPARG